MTVAHPAQKPVEARQQTTHKLDVMAAWWGAWCEIVAKAQVVTWCNRRLFLVDGFAGPGTHATVDPNAPRAGTATLAMLYARQSQRRHPGVRVRVDAVDRDPKVARELAERASRFGGEPPAGVEHEVHVRELALGPPLTGAKVTL